MPTRRVFTHKRAAGLSVLLLGVTGHARFDSGLEGQNIMVPEVERLAVLCGS